MKPKRINNFLLPYFALFSDANSLQTIAEAFLLLLTSQFLYKETLFGGMNDRRRQTKAQSDDLIREAV